MSSDRIFSGGTRASLTDNPLPTLKNAAERRSRLTDAIPMVVVLMSIIVAVHLIKAVWASVPCVRATLI